MSLEERIIVEVHKRDALWDPAHELHKNVGMLQKLWKEVAVAVNRDVKLVKSKWKNMRSYFFKEVQKMEKNMSVGDGKAITTTWQFFNQLLFLKDLAMDQDPGPWHQPHYDYDFDTPEVTTVLDEQPSIYQPSSPASSSNSIPPRSKKMRRNSDNNVTQQLLELEKRRLEIIENESQHELNDDLLFFGSLMPYFKRIDPIKKLRLRAKIQELIIEEIESAQKTEQQCNGTNTNDKKTL